MNPISSRTSNSPLDLQRNQAASTIQRAARLHLNHIQRAQQHVAANNWIIAPHSLREIPAPYILSSPSESYVRFTVPVAALEVASRLSVAMQRLSMYAEPRSGGSRSDKQGPFTDASTPTGGLMHIRLWSAENDSTTVEIQHDRYDDNSTGLCISLEKAAKGEPMDNEKKRAAAPLEYPGRNVRARVETPLDRSETQPDAKGQIEFDPLMSFDNLIEFDPLMSFSNKSDPQARSLNNYQQSNIAQDGPVIQRDANGGTDFHLLQAQWLCFGDPFPQTRSRWREIQPRSPEEQMRASLNQNLNADQQSNHAQRGSCLASLCQNNELSQLLLTDPDLWNRFSSHFIELQDYEENQQRPFINLNNDPYMCYDPMPKQNQRRRLGFELRTLENALSHLLTRPAFNDGVIPEYLVSQPLIDRLNWIIDRYKVDPHNAALAIKIYDMLLNGKRSQPVHHLTNTTSPDFVNLIRETKQFGNQYHAELEAASTDLLETLRKSIIYNSLRAYPALLDFRRNP